ncbi:magnesium-transporting ATPase MgtA [Salmonella enterica subsp. enterica]|uniref:Magnesium-transporting ATPase MgtA n=1 Tax=Salmonella enterica I TaxID=59201 RepID=A0A379X245_SALET|nr:magnesium-transporting ATPase MgtA [Salmonella enterica subsp. enterica]
MLPLHLLIQNLLYDVSQVAIPFDNVDEEQIQKPQRWNPADLGRFMVFFGPISSIFDILTFCLMWWVFHANTPETQTLFQSGWFVVGLLSQTLIVHMIRTRRLPFIQSRAAWPLMAMTLLVMVVGVSLPFSPLASYLQLQALPLSYFPWLIAILAGYMTLTQLVKGVLQPTLWLAVSVEVLCIIGLDGIPGRISDSAIRPLSINERQRRTAIASISIFTSFGRRATSTQERAGKVALCSVKKAS